MSVLSNRTVNTPGRRLPVVPHRLDTQPTGFEAAEPRQERPRSASFFTMAPNVGLPSSSGAKNKSVRRDTGYESPSESATPAERETERLTGASQEDQRYVTRRRVGWSGLDDLELRGDQCEIKSDSGGEGDACEGGECVLGASARSQSHLWTDEWRRRPTRHQPATDPPPTRHQPATNPPRGFATNPPPTCRTETRQTRRRPAIQTRHHRAGSRVTHNRMQTAGRDGQQIGYCQP